MPIALRYAARSDLGLGPKSRNEDSGYAGPHLLVLADGMGGHAAGDVASSMIVGQLAPLDDESIGADTALPTLERSIRDANRSLSAAMRDDPKLAGMGSTTIAMLRAGNKLAMAHIGDSRAYLLRDGVFSQITKDHSFVQQLVDEQRITRAEADDHPQRSLVTRVMTGQDEDEPDLSIRELKPGDRYLLCSDGLSDFVRSDVIQEILTEAASAEAAADRCIEVALRASARDNVTVVVADVVDLNTSEAPPTVPQVVGAAAVREREGRRTRGLPISPAEKAAQLTRETRAKAAPRHDDGDEDEEEITAIELAEADTRALARGRAAVVAVVAVVVLAGAAYAGWSWSQRQLFLGPADGYVATYRGVTQDIGPIRLSHVEARSDVEIAALPVQYQDLVADRIVLGDSTEAKARIESLRMLAISCRLQAVTGTPCGSLPAATASPTATRTPTAPTTGKSSGTPTRAATTTPSIRPTTGSTP